MERSWGRAKGAFAAVFAPPALFLLAFFLVPMGIVWAFSFGENAGLTAIAVTGTLDNYARALSPLYLGILWKSAWIAALTTLGCLVLGLPAAVAIAFARGRAKAWLLVLVMLPFWTNLLIRTYALIAVLREEGLANQTLKGLWSLLAWALAGAGLHPPPFRALELLHNNTAVVIGLVYVHLPFMVLPIYASLERMDRSLLEASLDLGAGPWRALWDVALPLAMPGIASGVLITFVPAAGDFLTPDLLGGTRSQMIANVIERQFKRANDWPFGAALSFLLMYLTFAAVAGRALMAGRKAARR
jgi:spermidine/putrescine transport system permease protein